MVGLWWIFSALVCSATRHEHLAVLREIYGYKMFSGRGARDLNTWLETEAEGACSGEDLALRFVKRCRATQTILPGVTAIEQLCADALVAAKRHSAAWDDDDLEVIITQ